MSLISFSMPSDTEVLNQFSNSFKNISFIGKGKIQQTNEETVFIRTLKIEFMKGEILLNAVFHKNGTNWLFRGVEHVSSA